VLWPLGGNFLSGKLKLSYSLPCSVVQSTYTLKRITTITGKQADSEQGELVRGTGREDTLKAGMTIRIPAKVRHNMVNTGTVALRTLVSFSSGDRKTVFIEEQPAAK
jgi:hypothetical protein